MTSQNTGLKPINKQFTSYVIPSVIGMVVQALYTILDGVIVGQGIGEIALGAVNLVLPFNMTIIALAMLIGIGGANVYSIYKGQGETEKANNIFCQCLALTAIVGGVLALAGFLFRENLVRFFGANEDLLSSAAAYLKWLAPFALIQTVSFGLSVFVRNDGAPKLAMTATIVGAVSNVILDIVLILVLHYDIEASAFTNGVGMVIELIFYATHLTRKQGTLRIRKPTFQFSDIKRILHNGAASFLMEFQQATISLSFNLALVRTVGTLGVSAYAIVNSMCALINMVLIGVSNGAQPLMSFQHGKGDRQVFSHIYRLAIRTNIILPLLLVSIYSIFGREIASLFLTGNSELTELAAHMFRLYPLGYIVVGPLLINILFFQTTEKNSYSTLLTFLRCIGFTQVFLLFFMYLLGANGIYLSFLAGELCHLILSQILVSRTRKRLSTEVGEKKATMQKTPVKSGYMITISREYASGGRIIGRKVAQALNIPFYDREIIGLAASQAQLAVGAVEQSDEKVEKGFQYGLYVGRKYMPIPDQVFIAQRKVIKEIADKGSCVIVGRCANSILRENKNCMHIFIHAPLAQRVRRAVEEYGLITKNAEQAVLDNDLARKSYYHHYTGAEWGDAHHYHLSINSDLGIERCIELILYAVRTSFNENIKYD